jgi:hypothetical protein
MKDFTPYSFFNKLVKEITKKIYRAKTFDSLSANIQQRLFLMGWIVKDKESWKDCGTILNRTAKGENYIWGLRFYKLLLECFQNWAIIDESGNIAEAFEKLKNSVDICETMVYWDCEPEEIEEKHEVLQKLYEGNNKNGNEMKITKNNNQEDDIIEDCEKFKELKENYINELFNRNVNAIQIEKKQNNYEDFFLQKGKKIANNILDRRDIKDYLIQSVFEDMEFSNDLFTYLNKKNPDYNDENELLNTRKFVYELLINRYGDCNTKFKNIIEESENKKPNNKKPVMDYSVDEIDLDRFKIKSIPKVKSDIQSNLDDELQKNIRLKNKKDQLEEEIARLEKKEKTLKTGKFEKKSVLLNQSKVTPDSKLLIEEINRKNKEYNVLKNKYNSLLYEMNSKLITNTNQSYLDQQNLKKTISDSIYNIERVKKSHMGNSFLPNTSEFKQSSFYSSQSYYKNPDYFVKKSNLYK